MHWNLALVAVLQCLQTTFARTIIVVEDDEVDRLSSQSHMINVDVGLHNQILFSPNQASASIGDVIQFTFHSFNHSVTQSSLTQPCIQADGFSSGFLANPDDSPNITVSFTVNTLEPQYFFCHQDQVFSHCRAGMVFAINAGETMNEFIFNTNNNTIRSDLNSTMNYLFPTLAGGLSPSDTSVQGLVSSITLVASQTLSTNQPPLSSDTVSIQDSLRGTQTLSADNERQNISSSSTALSVSTTDQATTFGTDSLTSSILIGPSPSSATHNTSLQSLQFSAGEAVGTTSASPSITTQLIFDSGWNMSVSTMATTSTQAAITIKDVGSPTISATALSTTSVKIATDAVVAPLARQVVNGGTMTQYSLPSLLALSTFSLLFVF